MYKVIILDLDGTLLGNDGILDKHECEYLIKLQEYGVKLIVATGRNERESNKIIEMLQLKKYLGAAVLADGQFNIDYDGYDIKKMEFMSYRCHIKKLCKNISTLSNDIRAYSSEKDYIVFDNCFSIRFLKNYISISLGRCKDQILFKTQNYNIDNIEKISIRPLNNKKDNFYIDENQFEVVYMHDKHRYELKNKGVNKLKGVKWILDKHLIKSENVIVFGNDENDICLFKYFPNSFAIEDSPQVVKNFAKGTICSAERHGIVKTLQELVKIKEVK